MISSTLATFLARRNIHYGWVVAAATFLSMLVTAGAMGAPGVLIVPLQQQFGWDTAQISAALALRLLLFGLVGPFSAAFMNGFGLRPVVMGALVLIAAGFLGSLFMTRIWELIFLWGVVIGVGTGFTATVLGATVATRWFTKRRGLVVGLLSASSATGQLIFLPWIAELTERFGWRAALAAVCAGLGCAALVALLLLRDRPSDLGLPLFGETEIAPRAPTAAGLGELLLSPLLALKEATQTGVFWVLFATFFVCGASTNGLIQTHFVTFCGDHGLPPVGAAGVLAMMGFFDFFGTLGSGWLSDRVDNRLLLFCYYGLRGCSLIYLPFSSFTFYGLSLFAAFYGLDWIATVPPTVKLAADRFGREKAGMVFGWIFTGHQIGAATAAFGAGLSRTEFSTYLPAFFAAGTLCIGASLLVLTLPSRKSQAARLTAAAPV
jgi:sugar phosphate permease